MVPDIKVNPALNALKVTVTILNTFFVPQFTFPHDPATITSFTGSFVVQSKLADQSLDRTQSLSDPTRKYDASNVMMIWKALISWMPSPRIITGTDSVEPTVTIP